MDGCWNDRCVLTECNGVEHVDATGNSWEQRQGTVTVAGWFRRANGMDENVSPRLATAARLAGVSVSDFLCMPGSATAHWLRQADREVTGLPVEPVVLPFRVADEPVPLVERGAHAYGYLESAAQHAVQMLSNGESPDSVREYLDRHVADAAHFWETGLWPK